MFAMPIFYVKGTGLANLGIAPDRIRTFHSIRVASEPIGVTASEHFKDEPAFLKICYKLPGSEPAP